MDVVPETATREEKAEGRFHTGIGGGGNVGRGGGEGEGEGKREEKGQGKGEGHDGLMEKAKHLFGGGGK